MVWTEKYKSSYTKTGAMASRTITFHANISCIKKKIHMHYIMIIQPNKINCVQIKEWTTVPSSLSPSIKKLLKPLRLLVEITQSKQYDSGHLDAASEHCERTTCPYNSSQNNFLLNQF